MTHVERLRVTAAMILALALSAVGVQIVSQTPAHAAWDNCATTDQVCAYEHTGGNGARVSLFVPLGQCTNLASGWNDRISSVWNKFSSPNRITFWYDAGCRGSRAGYDAGRATNVSIWDNDEFTSWCIGPITNHSVGCGRYV